MSSSDFFNDEVLDQDNRPVSNSIETIPFGSASLASAMLVRLNIDDELVVILDNDESSNVQRFYLPEENACCISVLVRFPQFSIPLAPLMKIFLRITRILNAREPSREIVVHPYGLSIEDQEILNHNDSLIVRIDDENINQKELLIENFILDYRNDLNQMELFVYNRNSTVLSVANRIRISQPLDFSRSMVYFQLVTQDENEQFSTTDFLRGIEFVYLDENDYRLNWRQRMMMRKTKLSIEATS